MVVPMPALAHPLLCSPRALLLFSALASSLALAVALTMQYAFAMHPCHLCILQRYPYAIVALLGIAGAFAPVPWRRWALLACALCFAVGTGIAAWHGMVERGVVEASASCTAGVAEGASLEELRAQIMGAPLVSCSQPLMRVMGVSLAEWNALVYAFLTLITSYGVWRSFRRTQPLDPGFS